MRFLSIGVMVVALVISGEVLGQTPRTVDPTPLERPKPLCQIKGDAVRPALQLVFDTLQSAGYSITQTDWDRGEVYATLAEGKAENRIIVWLEWDVLNPGKQMNLFFNAGRFEPFFGSTELRRVQLAANEEQRHFAAIRKALLTAALSKG